MRGVFYNAVANRRQPNYMYICTRYTIEGGGGGNRKMCQWKNMRACVWERSERGCVYIRGARASLADVTLEKTQTRLVIYNYLPLVYEFCKHHDARGRIIRSTYR